MAFNRKHGKCQEYLSSFSCRHTAWRGAIISAPSFRKVGNYSNHSYSRHCFLALPSHYVIIALPEVLVPRQAEQRV